MSLQYSLYNNESENIGPINQQKNESPKRDNKKSIEKIKALLSSSAPEKPDENNLADFVPLSYPEVNIMDKKRRKNKLKEKHDYSANDISIEKDEDLETTQSSDKYYKQYVSYSMDNANQVPQTTSNAPKDELMEKLNYMIHLLEEQSDEKTANVTEELILYMFLGVFIIFVLDSFAKMGKYVR